MATHTGRKAQAEIQPYEADPPILPPRRFAQHDEQAPQQSAPQARPDPTPTAPPKTAREGWTRDFGGGQGQVQLHLLLERHADGTLSGRYRAEGGAPNGWPFTGTLYQDGRFELRGLHNDVYFAGRYTTESALLIERFRRGAIHLNDFELRPMGPQTPLKPEQQDGATSAPTTTTSSTALPAVQPSAFHKPWAETIVPKNHAKLPALQEPGFLEEAGRVSQRLGVPRDMLLAVMAYESADWRRGTRGLDPKADNQLGYYGLTQIGGDALLHIMGSAAARNIERKVDPERPELLTQLTALQQLQYVEIYFKQHGLPAAVERAKKEGRQITLEELYMANLGGNATKAYERVWTNKQQHPKRYENNAGLDSDKDGDITPVEAADAVRLHWRDTFGTNIDERSRHLERETFQAWSAKKQRMVSDWRVKDHGDRVYSATMNLDPSQNVVPAHRTGTTQPPPSTTLKAGQRWEHRFEGRGSDGVTFQFQLARQADGSIEGTYSANGGKAWPVRGSLYPDGRIVLSGQDNKARLEGRASLSTGKITLSGAFRNGVYATTLEVTQAERPAAQAEAQPPNRLQTPNQNTPSTASQGGPDALDALLGLNAHLPRYTVEQIRAARKAIQGTSTQQQSQLYLLLQTKTPYHNQRNNESIGRKIDELNTPFNLASARRSPT